MWSKYLEACAKKSSNYYFETDGVIYIKPKEITH